MALGSNLGDRVAYLEEAVRRVGEHPAVTWVRSSSWFETEPVGGPPQGAFLNGAGELRTTLDPWRLLDHLQVVESRLGRTRDVRNGPRTIDLDILTYDSLIMDDGRIQLPHPRLCERAFVLEPLAEIAPHERHPVTGKTFLEHWLELRGRTPGSERDDDPRGGAA